MLADPPAANDPGVLAPADADRVAELAAATLAAPAPAQRALELIAALAAEQRPALAAALYEALVYRIELSDHWLHHRMWRVYDALGPARRDAAFFAAAAAVRTASDTAASGPPFSGLFHDFLQRGRDREAVDLFWHQMERLPEEPVAGPEVVDPLLRRFGGGGAGGPAVVVAPGLRHDHPVHPAEIRPAFTFRTFGGATPPGLRSLLRPATRPPISVAELPDAEVLLFHNALAVTDRNGELHGDLCITGDPERIRSEFSRLERHGAHVEQFEADEAVVISDRFPIPNVCHMLFDHLTRLALYQRLGVDTGAALVIGPEMVLPAQREILGRAGVAAYLGVGRVARVRVRRLWISSNCRDLQHAGHLGAAWAVEFIRRTLGGAGTQGRRRLYLSRADAAARRVGNEAEVVALLERHGFETIVPGDLPFDAQLAAFREASDVIAPHGAALAHLVLCPPGARALEMFHPLWGTASYAQQADAAGLRYAALMARDWDSDAPQWNDPAQAEVGSARFLDRHMRIDLSPLRSYLASLA